jgi:hypothetical protein
MAERIEPHIRRLAPKISTSWVKNSLGVLFPLRAAYRFTLENFK